MKKKFIEIIEKYKCKLITYNNENNFSYRYITIDIDDENNLHLDLYDYEYHIDDDKEIMYKDFEKWIMEQLS